MRQIYNGLKRSVVQNSGLTLLLIFLLTVSLVVLFLRPATVDRIRARVPFARTTPKPPPKVVSKGDKKDGKMGGKMGGEMGGDAYTDDEMEMYDNVEGYRGKKSRGKKKKGSKSR